jgi:hypothetical protein
MVGGKLGIPELLILLVIFLLVCPLFIVIWWRIFSKAGHPGALGITMMIPVVSFFVLLWFAFSEWPIEKRLKPSN